MEKKLLKIGGMKCKGCRKKVHYAIAALDGVKEVTVNLEKNQAEIEYDSVKVSLEEIKIRIKDAGHYYILEQGAEEKEMPSKVKRAEVKYSACKCQKHGM